MEETGPTLEDYVDILRRRKMLFIFTVPVLLFISVVVALSLPPIYRAEGVILIQTQEIPEELVKSTVNSMAEQQIEVTRQKILTSAKIMELIDKHKLYSDIRHRSSVSQLAENFKNSMAVQMIEGRGPHNARNRNIAFVVSFMDKDPVLAQRIANELTTLFLEENIKERTNTANETAKFLKEEADRMQVKVQEVENQIAEFKLRYGDSLPELLQFNLDTVERLEEQIIDAQDEQVRLNDQVHALNLELSQISPYTQFSSNASGRSITPRQRLMELKQEYSRLIISYSESHPDIVRLQKEIAIAEQEIAKTGSDVSEEDAVNPVYRQLKSRIKAAEKEIQRLGQRREQMDEDLIDFKGRIARTHQVKREYDDLTRDYQNRLAKYQELRSKQLEANVAQNMEAENKAGSFKLIEPPVVPESSVKPDRKKLLALGFILSFGAGIGLMLAAEFLDPGVRGVTNISVIVGQQPLAVVNHINTNEDFAERDKNRRNLLIIFVIFCVLGIAFFHFFVMSLDLLWYKIQAKINVM